MPIEVVEWPGGQPRHINLELAPQVYAAVRKGRATVPLGKPPNLANVAGLPWCSIGTLHSDGDKLTRIVGPAIRQPDQWVLPILNQFIDPATSPAEYKKGAEKLRHRLGLEPVSVS